VATGRYLEEDPALALQHALAARQLAPRIAAVREALGIASYHAEDWAAAIAELRAYHRMTGRQTHLAVLADCERALGRPEKAIDLYRSADRTQLTPAEAVELLVVAAGARRDLGQAEAAVAMLQVRELTQDGPWAARLRYAYADGLLAIGRADEAREWFARAAEVDEDAETDAAERLLDLDGVHIDEAEYDEETDEDGTEDEPGEDPDDEDDQIEDDGDDEDEDEDDGDDVEDDEDLEAAVDEEDDVEDEDAEGGDGDRTGRT
jgi:tetratricopeptide (TPR) repeat protein